MQQIRQTILQTIFSHAQPQILSCSATYLHDLKNIIYYLRTTLFPIPMQSSQCYLQNLPALRLELALESPSSFLPARGFDPASHLARSQSIVLLAPCPTRCWEPGLLMLWPQRRQCDLVMNEQLILLKEPLSKVSAKVVLLNMTLTKFSGKVHLITVPHNHFNNDSKLPRQSQSYQDKSKLTKTNQSHHNTRLCVISVPYQRSMSRSLVRSLCLIGLSASWNNFERHSS